MGRQRTVLGYHCPVIIQPFHIGSSLIDHRFDSQSHTGDQSNSPSLLRKIGNLRVFMKMGADTVSYQVPYYSISELPSVIADSSRYIMKMVSCFGIFDSFKEALPCHIDQLLSLRGNIPHSMSSGCI